MESNLLQSQDRQLKRSANNEHQSGYSFGS